MQGVRKQNTKAEGLTGLCQDQAEVRAGLSFCPWLSSPLTALTHHVSHVLICPSRLQAPPSKPLPQVCWAGCAHLEGPTRPRGSQQAACAPVPDEPQRIGDPRASLWPLKVGASKTHLLLSVP